MAVHRTGNRGEALLRQSRNSALIPSEVLDFDSQKWIAGPGANWSTSTPAAWTIHKCKKTKRLCPKGAYQGREEASGMKVAGCSPERKEPCVMARPDEASSSNSQRGGAEEKGEKLE
jgi:hypothetical protein